MRTDEPSGFAMGPERAAEVVPEVVPESQSTRAAQEEASTPACDGEKEEDSSGVGQNGKAAPDYCLTQMDESRQSDEHGPFAVLGNRLDGICSQLESLRKLQEQTQIFFKETQETAINCVQKVQESNHKQLLQLLEEKLEQNSNNDDVQRAVSSASLPNLVDVERRRRPSIGGSNAHEPVGQHQARRPSLGRARRPSFAEPFGCTSPMARGTSAPAPRGTSPQPAPRRSFRAADRHYSTGSAARGPLIGGALEQPREPKRAKRANTDEPQRANSGEPKRDHSKDSDEFAACVYRADKRSETDYESESSDQHSWIRSISTPDEQESAQASPANSPPGRKHSICSASSGASISRRISLSDGSDFMRRMTTMSFGASESAIHQSRFLLLPRSIMRLAWDVFTAVSIIFTGALLPVCFAYLEKERLSQGFLGVVFATVDFIWIIDIFINLRTAYVDSGKLVTSGRSIFIRYAHGWLTFDLLAACPVMMIRDDSAFAYYVVVVKLLRLCRIWMLFAKFQSFTSMTLYPCLVGFTSALLCNILTCAWRLTQEDDGTGTPAIDLYVKDAYWVMMTMSTVGFGDIVPGNTAERVYGIFVMTIAPLVFGATVTLTSHAIQALFNDKIAIQVARATKYMNLRGVQRETQWRVQHSLRRNIQQESRVALASEILAKLPPLVQRDLLSELLRSTVFQFPLFHGASNTFIGELSQHHSWVECAPGDLVVEEGHVVEEVVFIIRGRLLVHSVQSGEDIEFKAGAWFGEACLFDADRVREHDVTAVTQSELAVLRASDYHEVVKKYPRVLARHQRIAEDLASTKLSFQHLQYKRPLEEERTNTGSLRLWMPGWCERKQISFSQITPASR